jgi:hypothetical protein
MILIIAFPILLIPDFCLVIKEARKLISRLLVSCVDPNHIPS